MGDLKKNSRKKPPTRLLLLGVFCLAVLGGLAALQVASASDRILPNISVAGIPVGGLTADQAKAKLATAVRALNVAGVSFTYQDRAVTVRVNDTDGLVRYDIDKAVESAFAFGHDGKPVDLAVAKIQAFFSDVILPSEFSIDADGLKKLLVERFANFEHPKQNADIQASMIADAVADASGTMISRPAFSIAVIPETDGTSFNYDDAVAEATADFLHWRGGNVMLKLTADAPDIKAGTASDMRDAATAILDRGGINLVYDDKRWMIDTRTLASALTLKARPDGTPYIGLRPGSIDPIFKKAAAVIETDPAPTRLTLDANGKATDFTGGSIGKHIDRKATIELADDRLSDPTLTDVPISVDTVFAQDSDPIAEQLGIRELLGYGTSNMAGSPNNRRKNIANGASLLNGTIVKPGEEFSLLDQLRPFTTENGYYKELIIKGDRTVPDVGGGLCQIGTTTFRATMGSGLPVTVRQNHSYRVSYYEPAGTDATIFDPAPDYRFLNDTGNSILITTKITGNILRFEFWGTRDGRAEKQSKVDIWDITQPPDPKLIETSSLAEGKKRCFETAHAGAKTKFTYTITYPDGSAKSKVFSSVYKPWQAQCLIGKAGAPNIIIDSDGSIKELPPIPSATSTSII